MAIVSVQYLGERRLRVYKRIDEGKELRGPEDLDRLFKALGHVTRRRILRLLASRPYYPYELAKSLELNRRVVLKHLSSLQDAGLVERESAESDVGPDRVYYKLTVSYGISTTLLPDAFGIRIIRHVHSKGQEQRRRSAAERKRPDVSAVQSLLKRLQEVDRRIEGLERERMKFASIRGEIIRRIESIMAECEWDSATTQKVRMLINPVKSEAVIDERELIEVDDPFKEVLLLFESIFKAMELEKDE